MRGEFSVYLFPFAPALKGTGSFSRILQSACRGVEWGGVCVGGTSAMNSAPPVHLLTSSWFPDEFHGHPSWLPIFQQHTLHVVFQWVSGKSSHCPSWFSSKFNNPPPPPHRELAGNRHRSCQPQPTCWKPALSPGYYHTFSREVRTPTLEAAPSSKFVPCWDSLPQL